MGIMWGNEATSLWNADLEMKLQPIMSSSSAVAPLLAITIFTFPSPSHTLQHGDMISQFPSFI